VTVTPEPAPLGRRARGVATAWLLVTLAAHLAVHLLGIRLV
jgi:hypothetical protein